VGGGVDNGRTCIKTDRKTGGKKNRFRKGKPPKASHMVQKGNMPCATLINAGGSIGRGGV